MTSCIARFVSVYKHIGSLSVSKPNFRKHHYSIKIKLHVLYYFKDKHNFTYRAVAVHWFSIVPQGFFFGPSSFLLLLSKSCPGEC